MSKRCIIVCSGEISNYKWFKEQFSKNDFVICADGGTRHLRRIGISPDLIMGDMDSTTDENLRFFSSKGIPIKKFFREKDFTDAELAFNEAVESGYKDILILAGTGSRLDHSMANIFLLKKAADIGIDCCIRNEENYLWMLKGLASKALDISTKSSDWKDTVLSLLPLSDTCEGVYTKGLKYRLDNAVMYLGAGTGISNEFENDTVTVGLRKGYLILILAKV